MNNQIRLDAGEARLHTMSEQLVEVDAQLTALSEAQAALARRWEAMLSRPIVPKRCGCTAGPCKCDEGHGWNYAGLDPATVKRIKRSAETRQTLPADGLDGVGDVTEEAALASTWRLAVGQHMLARSLDPNDAAARVQASRDLLAIWNEQGRELPDTDAYTAALSVEPDRSTWPANPVARGTSSDPPTVSPSQPKPIPETSAANDRSTWGRMGRGGGEPEVREGEMAGLRQRERFTLTETGWGEGQKAAEELGGVLGFGEGCTRLHLLNAISAKKGWNLGRTGERELALHELYRRVNASGDIGRAGTFDEAAWCVSKASALTLTETRAYAADIAHLIAMKRPDLCDNYRAGRERVPPSKPAPIDEVRLSEDAKAMVREQDAPLTETNLYRAKIALARTRGGPDYRSGGDA